MIPLRVTLEGFMSYQDRTTFSFDGKPLWMLAGPNGAGKSAVFDAITYALYDQHRLGGQRHIELIHKRADGMSVEFEFACGDDVYAVKRTRARKGHTSREVFHIRGPHAPNPSRSGPQAVPETSSDKGFNKWVGETIGLTYETFTASVLLRQGDSDALLKADSAERHEMLGQIVDLSSYQRLHDEADKRHKDFQADARSLQGQLEGLAPVAEHELAELAEIVAAQGKAAQESQGQLLHLAGLKVHAANWTRLTRERTEIHAALDEARRLLVQEEQIEREAARLAELRAVVPVLDALLEARGRVVGTDRAIVCYAQTIDALRQQARDAQDAQEEQRHTVEGLRAQRADLDRAQHKAQGILVALVPQVAGIERLDRVQGDIAVIDRALSAFAPDLDEQCAALTAEVDDLTALQVALPWLGRFVEARTRWREAGAKGEDAQQRLAGIRAGLPANVTAQGVTSAAGWHERAQAEVTRACTLLAQEQARLERLQEVEGKPLCSYCGQELRPEHIADEQRCIDAAIQGAEDALRQAAEACERASGLKESEQEAERDLRDALGAAAQAERDGLGAFAEMPQAYRAHIASALSDAAEVFAKEYPTEGDIGELPARAGGLVAVKGRLQGIQGEIKKRDKQCAQREPLVKELAELEGKYPPDVTVEVRAAFEREQARCQEAERGLEELREPLDEAEAALVEANRTVETIGDKLRDAEARQGEEAARRQEQERAVEERQAAVPEGWQVACAVLTAERVVPVKIISGHVLR